MYMINNYRNYVQKKKKIITNTLSDCCDEADLLFEYLYK